MRANDYIDQLRSDDTETFNNALEELRQNIDVTKTRVFAAVQRENDPIVKGALIELLGESKDETYIPYIKQQMRSDEPEVVFWAFASLQRIGTKEAMDSAKKRDIQTITSTIREIQLKTPK